LPETNQHMTRERLHFDKSIRDIIRAFTMPHLRSLFTVGFLYQSGFSFFVTFFGVFLIHRYGFNQSAIGNLFAYIGIWVAVTQAGLTPRVAKFWKEKRVLSFSFLGTGLVTLLYLLPGPWTIMLAIIPFFAVFNGLSQANYMGLLSRSADQKVQGEILGINASVGALSQSLPPILSGIIAAEAAPEATVIMAGVIMISSGIVFLLAKRDPVLAAAH